MATRRNLPFIAALALALAATNAASAPATPKGAPPGYESKFKEVVEAEKNEEYEKALALLDEIPAEKFNVYTRLKRASLLVRLGRFIEAEERLSDLLTDPRAEVIREVVKGDLEDLRARMPKLTIRLSAKSKSAADAWITVDGKSVGPPVTIPLNPGDHVVLAKRGEVVVFRQKLSIQDSQSLDVEIDTSFTTPPPNPSARPIPIEKPLPAPSANISPARPPALALVTAGAGVVVLGIGGAFALSARSRNADSKGPALCTEDDRYAEFGDTPGCSGGRGGRGGNGGPGGGGGGGPSVPLVFSGDRPSMTTTTLLPGPPGNGGAAGTGAPASSRGPTGTAVAELALD